MKPVDRKSTAADVKGRLFRVKEKKADDALVDNFEQELIGSRGQKLSKDFGS